jgi:hypothetical protein
MANELKLHDLLKFHPEWVKDPVPPWVFDILDKATLRELAVVSLQNTLEVQRLNMAATEKAIGIIQKAKL